MRPPLRSVHDSGRPNRASSPRDRAVLVREPTCWTACVEKREPHRLSRGLFNCARTLEIVEQAACESACHKPLAEMIKEMVEAFVDAKMERADISVALYRVSADLGGPALAKRVSQRSRKAVEAMLQTASDTKSPPDKCAIDMMLAAMAGAIRSLLEAEPSPSTVRKSREQLVLLCQSYMAAATA